MYDEAAAAIAEYRARLSELRAALNVERTREKIAALEKRMEAQDFWDDVETAQNVSQELKTLRDAVEAPDRLEQELEDGATLVELAVEEEDETMGAEIEEVRASLERQLRGLELTSLFTDPRDDNNAIVNIHPGAGGTESCDWADMLFRMVCRFCEQRGFVYEVLEYQEGEEAGLKSATIIAKGPYAYGTLKSEEGVHRLVRISPFDAAKRRHTSFVAVEVVPEMNESIDIEVKDEDLRVDTYRSSGAGGQKVNKTSSAVRLTHIPTGVVVACQIERSQHRNRATALQMLKAKLYDMELKKQEAAAAANREGQSEIGWGSQIRSYVLQPYQMIKDLRTGHETGNVQRVLDGDLEGFVEAYLKWNLERRQAAQAG